MLRAPLAVCSAAALAVACSGRTVDRSTADGTSTDAGSATDAGSGTDAGRAPPPPPDSPRMPSYAPDGRLQRPSDWQRWVFLGASLDLSYAPSPSAGHVFANTYMEPTAFDHFVETGDFREGTQTVLALYAGASGEPPAVQGQYQGALTGLEMSVKDSSKHPDTAWAYYGFGGGDAAAALPPASCFTCHDENAATDHVFTQFYPVLRDRAAR